MKLRKLIKKQLKKSGGRIPLGLITQVVAKSTVTHHQLTPNMRVCVITLPTGHEVLGKAQVLLASNDEEAIGQKVALHDARNQLWGVLGSIAKEIISEGDHA